MRIVARVGLALQQLFGPLAEQAAAAAGVVVRRRKFTPGSLARTFVLGYLDDPRASDEKLARMATPAGAAVTPQAVAQRYTPRLVAFLEGLFRRAVTVAVGSNRALAPLLERFSTVTLLDSTTITLPDDLAGRFPGCGGKGGGGQAALKLQTELDLRSGALEHVAVEPGKSPDGATPRQHAGRPAGSLRVTDLGYFNVAVFAALVAQGAHFLSRLQFGTGVLLGGGTPLELLAWLGRQAGPFVDREVLLGLGERLPCRLIAWRLPPEQANRRRQKLRREVRDKRGRQPSAGRLAWCDWTILVTSVPADRLRPTEAAVLYRARWQVELLFKRWKSQDAVAALRGSGTARQMAGVWARLLAALVQHWLVLAGAWGDPTKSLAKACEAVRAFAGRLAAALGRAAGVEHVLEECCQVLAKTCRRDPRAKPGTFELLNDPGRLEFGLT